MGYLILFITLIMIVLWGFTIYFVKTGKLSAKDWYKRSLGLPRGSVRALLTFVILFMLISCVLTDTAIPDLPDWLVGILGTIIGFYFGAAMVPSQQSSNSDRSATSESH